MEISSRKPGNTELDSKEEVRLGRDGGVIQAAKIMKSWEWLWEWTKREQKGQRTNATGTLASNKGWEEERKQAKTESVLQVGGEPSVYNIPKVKGVWEFKSKTLYPDHIPSPRNPMCTLERAWAMEWDKSGCIINPGSTTYTTFGKVNLSGPQFLHL